MFSMFKWPIGRAGRGTMFLWFALGNLALLVLKLLVLHQANLGALLSFPSEAVIRPAAFPIWYVGLAAAFNLALIVVMIARLHDIGKPGWWLLGFVALAALAMLPALGFILLLILPLWLALLFWPGTFGPNAYGPHPLGWESREQYERQMRELREHVPPGKA